MDAAATAAATAPAAPSSKRARDDDDDGAKGGAAAGKGKGPGPGRVPKVLLNWLVDRLRTEVEGEPPSRDFYDSLAREMQIVGGAAAALVRAGVAGTEHVGALTESFATISRTYKRCARYPYGYDWSEAGPIIGTFADWLVKAPLSHALPHLPRVLAPVDRELLGTYVVTLDLAARAQSHVLRVGHAHSQALLSSLAQLDGGNDGQQPPLSPQPTTSSMERTTISATVEAYVQVLQDGFWLSAKHRGYAGDLEKVAMAALESLPTSIARRYVDIVQMAIRPILPHFERCTSKSTADYTLRVLNFVPAATLLPAHADAAMALLRRASTDGHQELAEALLGKLQQYQEGGGDMACLAPFVGDLMGAMDEGDEATGAAATDRMILRLLEAIPADAFGPAPADGGGGADGGSDVAVRAVESLLALMRDEGRGGLVPNEARAKALRALPLQRIVAPRLPRVFETLGELRTVYVKRKGEERAEARWLVQGGYKLLIELPAEQLVPALLDVCLEPSLRNDNDLVDAVCGWRSGRGRSEAFKRVMDSHAGAVLEKLKEAGVAAVDMDSRSHQLLKQMTHLLTREGWLGIKDEIQGMIGMDENEEVALLLMQRLYIHEHPPVFTDAELANATTECLSFYWNKDVVLRAFHVSGCFDERKRAQRVAVVEPYADHVLSVAAQLGSKDSLRTLETFCLPNKGLRPLLLDHLGDVLPAIVSRAPDIDLERLRAAIKALATLPPAALEPYVGEFVKLLDFAAEHKAIQVHVTVLRILERMPPRFTRDYTLLMLRAAIKWDEATAQALDITLED